jgi:hypothetical protein
MSKQYPITKILNNTDYENALMRLEEVFGADISTVEGIEASQLVEILTEYEKKMFPFDSDCEKDLFESELIDKYI